MGTCKASRADPKSLPAGRQANIETRKQIQISNDRNLKPVWNFRIFHLEIVSDFATVRAVVPTEFRASDSL
jgi:hypothetical protein